MRTVTLVLVDPSGELLGALAPFDVEVAWWQEVGELVDGARERFGVEVTVLRLLANEAPYPGGRVTYLAETADHPPLEPWEGALTDDPQRAAWARPGGPGADLAWADEVLAGRGLRRVGPARQVRSWNLSSLWRLPLPTGAAWLKVVPPFFAHEGALLQALAGAPVPTVLGADGPRTLLVEVPGEDRYEAGPSEQRAMVRLLVELQASWIDRTDELAHLGLPVWSCERLVELSEDVVRRNGRDLDAHQRRAVEILLGSLERRLAAVRACGIPDSVVHGDFHRGNFRGDPLTLLDWGDAGLGSPLLDVAAFTDRVPPANVPALLDEWAGAWQSRIPGSETLRAIGLLAPVAALRMAVIFRQFLDRIEASERAYHVEDPLLWLRRAAAA